MFGARATTYLAGGTEAAAAVIIAIAALEATMRAVVLLNAAQRFSLNEEKEAIRISLGHWLTAAIEVAPTWNVIGRLAAIVVLRTVLNYFLQQEIARAAKRKMPIQAVSLPRS